MNLIKITVKNIKYEMVIEKPRLEKVQNAETSKYNQNLQSKVSNVNKDNIKFNSDTYQSSVSNINNLKSLSKNLIPNYSSGYSNILYNSQNSSVLSEIDNIKYDKVLSNKDAQMIFIPSVGPQISYGDKFHDISYVPINMDFDFNIPISDTVYHPGSVSLNIVQWPSVIIEYIGDRK